MNVGWAAVSTPLSRKPRPCGAGTAPTRTSTELRKEVQKLPKGPRTQRIGLQGPNTTASYVLRHFKLFVWVLGPSGKAGLSPSP